MPIPILFAAAGAVAGGAAAASWFGLAAVGASQLVAGAAYGWMVGSALGSYVGTKNVNQKVESGRLTDLNITVSTYGVTIPRVWGAMRISGNVIVLAKLWENRKQKTKNRQKTVTYTYGRDYSAVAFCKGPIYRFEKVWGNEKLIYVNDDSGARAFNQEWKVDQTFLGTETQVASTNLIGNGVNAADLSGYRGLAYLVWGQITYGEFGNSMPNLTALVKTTVSGTVALSEILTDVCASVGLEAEQIDVTDVAGITVQGFRVATQTAARTVLEQLQSAYFFDAVETNGKLVFKRRGLSAVAVTIPASDLVLFDANGVSSVLVSVTREEETNLPQRVEVTYLAPSLKYEQHTKRAERINTTSREVVSVDVPLALTHDEAQAMAQKLLNLRWQEREKYNFQTGIKYAYLDVGDVVQIETGAFTYTILITEMQIGLYGRIAFQGVSHAQSLYTPVIPLGDEPSVDEDIIPLADTVLYLIDSPVFEDTYRDPMWYVGVRPNPIDGRWPEGEIYVSSDDVTYTYRESLDYIVKHGVAVTVLESGPYLYWDEGNTVDITMGHGTLESATAADVLNFANLAILGNEWIQWKTATLVSGTTYRLSGLLRGRFGTEWAVGTHAVDDVFIPATELTVSPITLAQLNVATFWKPVTEGQVEAEVAGTSYTNVGRAITPYAPHLYTAKYVAGTLEVTWWRRTRYARSWGFAQVPPLDETREEYVVRLTQGILTVEYGPSTGFHITTGSFSRTQAALTEDGFNVSAAITVRVYQVNRLGNVGWASNAITV